MIERTFIKKNYNRMELENYLTKKLDRAGFSHLEIIKTPLVTRIVLHAAKPGLAIGKSGSTIKTLTEVIAKKYKIDNPQIEIQEIKKPNLNAKIIVEKMASMMNRGYSWRSISFRVVKDIMDSGAQGVELVFKGALGAKGARKRKQRIAIGYMKKIGAQSKLVDRAQASANPKIGAIGIKLSIIHPEVIFPDKIDVKKVMENMKKVKEEKKEQEIESEKKEDNEKVKDTSEETTKQNKEEAIEIKKEDKNKETKIDVKKTNNEKELKDKTSEETTKQKEVSNETKNTNEKEDKPKKEGIVEKISKKVEKIKHKEEKIKK